MILPSLAHRSIADARIQAFQHPQVAPPPQGWRGGLVLGDGEEDARLRQTRSRKPVDSFDPAAEYPSILEGSYVYAGATYHHFGHVMAEMVHRIIPSKAHVRDPHWVLVTTPKYPRNTFEKLFDWLKPIYEFLELNESNVSVLNQNTIVSELFVCEQGSDYGGGAKPGYLDLLADYTHGRLDKLHGAQKSNGRIYVSRSAYGSPGSILGERYVERILAAEGFEVFHPENCSFTEQMDTYRKAELLVFPEGSACHGVELLGTGSLGRCVFLNRRHNHIQIFRKTLEPRATEFLLFDKNVTLGSLAANPATGNPLEHLGVSLFDFDALVEFFRNTGLASMRGATRRDYLEEAERDLFRHIERQAMKEPMFTNLDLLKKLLHAFDAARA
ncbi:glycosyltransferase 61 family protein [Microvirga flavescens]|uniref:glycosyltransferase 61 family protein n=1 Tax=Microvirga flavescens TaxID=2249811 RepID=UPI000DD92672|nr:glycosyltransferase family 61 protein [Microvirga flavescens]